MDQVKEVFMYVEEGLKQFYIAAENGWALMPGSRFYVCQDIEGGRLQEPFAMLFDTSGDSEQVGLLVAPERSGTPFTEPVYVDKKELMETGSAIAETAQRVISLVLDDVGGSLQQLQKDIESRRDEMIELLGPMG